MLNNILNSIIELSISLTCTNLFLWGVFMCLGRGFPTESGFDMTAVYLINAGVTGLVVVLKVYK